MDPVHGLRFDQSGLDLEGLEAMPGLVNAHDHLEFALFPRLGRGPYRNATEWARDIYRPGESPIREHLAVPKALRLIWGGLRNLLAGVTTVCHHNPWHPVFDEDFPVRIVRRFGWAHSFEFSGDVLERLSATTPDEPFILHLGEGTDAASAQELHRLHAVGGLSQRTVLVHAVGLDEPGWELVRKCGASVVLCPRSNCFTLGATVDPARLLQMGIPVALATDSSLTSEGDLLDEIQFVRRNGELAPKAVRDMVTRSPRGILGLGDQEEDWVAAPGFGAPPELVVVQGEIRLIGPRLAAQLRPEWSGRFWPLRVEGRDPVWTPFDVPALIQGTRAALGGAEFSLAGRRVLV